MIPPLFSKQEVGIWRVKKRFPRYGVPIWSLGPNIRFLPLIVAEKNVTKNILDGRKDRGKTVYPPPPPGSGGIINQSNWTHSQDLIGIWNYKIVSNNTRRHHDWLHGSYILTTYAISDYHDYVESEYHSWRSVLNTTLCNKVGQYIIKFASDLLQISCFLQVIWFPPPP